MNRLYVSVLLFILLLFPACKPKPVGECIIPRETFRDILVEVHLADGIYAVRNGKLSLYNDTLNFYNDIFRRFGYNKACFDSTYKYYCRNTIDFDKLYEEVITELSKTQQDIYRLQIFETYPAQNLYKGKQHWRLPLQGRNNKVEFDVTLAKCDTGFYTILSYLRFYRYDGTHHPRLNAYLWYDDGTKEGNRLYFPEITYEKILRYKLYSTKVLVKSKKYTHIRGYVVNSDKKDDFRHLEVKDIVVFNDK